MNTHAILVARLSARTLDLLQAGSWCKRLRRARLPGDDDISGRTFGNDDFPRAMRRFGY
ncbi:MAG TPA: hypothetical protein VHG70_03270 [Nocardioidaceae bacterium]|nr:hypothetical protein [Nocardioidaceae bacterium]